MKDEPKDQPHLRLERVFHEPNRLAIMSTLCGTEEGTSFNDLKSALDLTDGNLSRHLKALEESGAVEITKSFQSSKPRTTVAVTEAGREGFIVYLKTLEEVLLQAARSLEAEVKAKKGAKKGLPASFWRRVAEA